MATDQETIARLTAERDEARLESEKARHTIEQLTHERNDLLAACEAREAGYLARANGLPIDGEAAWCPALSIAWVAGWRENHNRIALCEIKVLAQEIDDSQCELARKILALCGGA